jgi:ABC-type nitrate/sulfonate/bicarbonate transport system permease component
VTSSSVIERGRRWGLDVAVPSILIVVIVVGVWWWLVDTGRVPTIVVPTPAAVWSALTDLVISEAFRPHLVTTLTETLVAFLLAAAAGLAIAFLMTRSRVLARVVYPYVVGLQAVPKVILAPILRGSTACDRSRWRSCVRCGRRRGRRSGT